MGKAFVLGVIGLGTLLATAGVLFDMQWPHLLLDLFRDVK
jgi:hypothetical protein